MNRWAKLAIALGLLTVAGVGLTASLVADEPTSSFAQDEPSPLVTAARDGNHEAYRLIAGPSEVHTDAGLDPAETVYVLKGANAPLRPAEVDAFNKFLEHGGQAIVADAFGHAGSLTEPHGVVIERVRLIDPAPDVTITLGDAQATVPLTNASPLFLEEGTDASVLATSSPESFIDRDGDGTIDENDPQGAIPLVVEVPVGEGRLIVLASPSLLDTAHVSGSSAPWPDALLEYVRSEPGTVLVDEAHGATNDPLLEMLGGVLGVATQHPWRIGIGVGAVLMLAAALVPTGLAPWGPHRFRPNRFLSRSLLQGANGDNGASDNGNALASGASGPVFASGPDPSHEPHAAWTQRGRLALLGAGFLAMTGLVFGNPQATTSSAILLVASAWAFTLSRPRVDAERELSTTQAPENTPVEARLTLKNRHRRSLEIELRDPIPDTVEVTEGHTWFSTRLPGHAKAKAPYALSPAVRGPQRIGPLLVRRHDPLGLRRHQAVLAEAQTLTVRPRPQDVRSLPFTTKVPTPTLGPHTVNRAGDGSEFHSLREYQQGDSFRKVNWKASARSEDLFVNQRVHESMTTLILLLDARTIANAGPIAQNPINRGARITMSLAEGATKARDRVRILAYGDQVHEVPPGPRSDQLHQLEMLLAKLPAEGSMPLMDVVETIKPDLTPRTPVLVVSGMEDDPTFVDAMKELRVRGALPTVVALPLGVDPVDEDETGEPDADELKAWHEDRVSTLRSSGVNVYDAGAEVPLEYLFRLGGGTG